MEETDILDTLYYARLEKISKINKEDIGMLGDISLRITEYEKHSTQRWGFKCCRQENPVLSKTKQS